jgi:hypothetical protein
LPLSIARNRSSSGAALAIAILGLTMVIHCLHAAETPPVLRTAQEVFRPDEPIDVFIENAPDNNVAWMTVVKSGAGDREVGVRLLLKDQAPPGRRDRWYRLPPQEEGDYELRLFPRWNFVLGASLPVRVAATEKEGPASLLTPVFADRLIEFVAGDQSRYPEPFGHAQGPFRPAPVDPAIVLGDPGPGPFNSSNRQLEFLTLPKGSYVTVGFSEHLLFDAPGPDLFVRGLDLDESAGEIADVFVSADLETFVFVDQIRAAGAQPLDLANLGLTEPVAAVRVVGTDLKGSFPGLELVSVEAAHGLARDQLDPDAVAKWLEKTLELRRPY